MNITDSLAPELAQELSDFALFPEMNPGPVCRLSREGIVLLANSKAKRVFGESNLLGQSWLDICPGLSADIWSRVCEAEDTYAIEAKLGETWMLFTHVNPENRHYIFVYGTDITANKENERKLEEQAATIREIARFPDMNPGPVLRVDLEGSILLSNAAATNVFGENLQGRNWKSTLPGLTADAWRTIVESTKIVPIESRIGDREFVFHHRRDFHTNLVFTYGTDITLQKVAERSLRQSEKMATLGTLAAGVAHELNNPAAATKRAADQLRQAIDRLEQAHLALDPKTWNDHEREILEEATKRVATGALQPNTLDAMVRSDREAEIEEWLDENEFDEAWLLAPSLVAAGFERTSIEDLSDTLQTETMKSALPWLASLMPVYSLLHEISEGSGRISEIVVALKNYSYLGQAPIQAVNIHEGIDNTLVILRNKLKRGITVHREYSAELPSIMAYGSELNQAWTNLIDNAADAMQGEGTITIRTRKDADWAVIEIEDNGPGIPKDIQSRIFDPFFTTKAPGKGTGLGLSTTYGIITEKHRGSIHLTSRPGCTLFTVTLPIGATQPDATTSEIQS